MAEVKLGQLVELFLIDTAMMWDAVHPMHIHGYDFGVIAMAKVSIY
jgi:FtsP/CotA-like multicopper oxidase with cupredoxin domain